MGTYRCCESAPAESARAAPASRPTRVRAAMQWILPAAGLALLPKCPACLAAYIAVATGFGISLAAAAFLRTAAVAICAAALGFFALPRVARILIAVARALTARLAVAPSPTCHR